MLLVQWYQHYVLQIPSVNIDITPASFGEDRNINTKVNVGNDISGLWYNTTFQLERMMFVNIHMFNHQCILVRNSTTLHVQNLMGVWTINL